MPMAEQIHWTHGKTRRKATIWDNPEASIVIWHVGVLVNVCGGFADGGLDGNHSRGRTLVL